VYYELKQQGAKVSNRTKLVAWEKRILTAKPLLSAMESKKIQQVARRLWKRISD